MTDITYYIRIKGKFVYLSAIIDLHSRRVISRIISHDMKTRLVVDTLKQSLKTRRGIVPKQIIFHNDRGIQYTSEEFRQELERLGIIRSMSGKGECWDNALRCTRFSGLLPIFDGTCER
ncbi:MAG: DDE-type integrase/transposase/recombinase [Thermoguttaceae bacterium]|nr:DDE-type integrase/transposase/recombinase [Thermoguttaceae bacterium]